MYIEIYLYPDYPGNDILFKYTIYYRANLLYFNIFKPGAHQQNFYPPQRQGDWGGIYG